MSRFAWQSRWWRGILVGALLTPLSALGFAFWRASHARQDAAAEVRAGSAFAFQVLPVDRPILGGVEPIAAVPDFQDIAAFHDGIVVSARAGLYLYDHNGALVRVCRVGIELPPAELGPMAVGIAAGSAAPELFVATRGEGVLAFDGSRFRQVLPTDPTLLNITSVLVAGSGRILLGTEHHGVVTYDGHMLAPLHPEIKSAHITAIAGDEADLWIGTLGHGVFHYRAGQLEDLAAALPDPQVLSIAVAGGVAYVGTPLGTVEFREGRKERTLADGFFARALAERGGVLHVATEDEGTVEVPLRGRTTAAGDAPAALRRLAVIEGELYGVGDAAVYRYDSAARRWQPVLNAGGAVLADRNVAALALCGGRLWVGYFDRGLDILDVGLDRATHHESDAIFCVNRIVPDPDGRRTAVATANGLVMFDAGAQPRQVMGRKDGLLSDHVTDVAFREGGMVVATPAGLSFVDAGGVRSLYVFHGLVNNHVYTVAARGSEVVAGTLGGLSVLDRDAVRANYTTANSHLKHNWITALARVGGEWFAGTYGAGVLRLDGSGEWRSFPDLKDGFVVNPNAMAVSGGRVYAGSLDRGLYVFDIASGRWTSTTLGLPSKNVTAIAADGGQLYVGTDNGVVRMQEGALR